HRHDPGGEHYSQHVPCEDSTDHATRPETAEQYGQATPDPHGRQRQDQQVRRTVGTSTRHAHRWRAESECQRSHSRCPEARSHARAGTYAATSPSSSPHALRRTSSSTSQTAPRCPRGTHRSDTPAHTPKRHG